MELKVSDDSITISRAMASKEVRSATNPAEKAMILISEFNVQKSTTSKEKVCSPSALKRASLAKKLGHRIGKNGNPHKLSTEDEDSIVQYLTMLIKEGIPVYLENVTSLVCTLNNMLLSTS